ncbi:jacalin-like lectin [Gynuella sunshinyii]|uniref:Jacalin-type lectin domain-containing protein n=1 Tax=Gynuella sunshinyii YC6258 TaxID=1445510 RepID=A0A0C5VFA3_9GAMM|nr:jacalin-like lectin [Gynuella sunshinyii]AJQ92836.1 hypothetical Protein YC6258_00786 [Gynuella sunshinyii YC6258]
MKKLLLMMLTCFSAGAIAAQFEAGNSGGGGGVAFFDNPPNDFLQLDRVTLCGGRLVDSVEVVYIDGSGNVYSYGKHGGNGGSCKTLNFMSGEYISKVSGKSGSEVDSLTITTNMGRTLSVGGSGGDSGFLYTGNGQFQIVGFKGRSGSRIDAIGVVYLQTY